MKNKLRIIFGYTFVFLESLMLLSIVVLLVLKFTLLNNNYLKNQLEKNNYYEKLSKEIKTEMSYYTEQSGFDDTILEDIFKVSDVKSATNKYISSIYTGETEKFDTTLLEEKLNKNITNYLKDDNFKVTNNEEIQKFIKQMSKIYNNEIKLMGYTDSIGTLIPKLKNVIEYILLVLSLTLLLFLIINAKLFKRKEFSIILYTTSFLLLFFVFYIKNSIDINNISIYSEIISNLIKVLIKNVLNIFILLSCIFIGVGLVLGILKKERRRHRHHHRSH